MQTRATSAPNSGFSGYVSLALAIALFLRPDIGALSLATVFGLFSLICGSAMLATAAQVKSVADAAGG